ncbi:MAG: LysE family transporter [Acidihalobacter sp.]
MNYSMQLVSSFSPLALVAILWTLAAISPGPNFLLTVQMAMGRSRSACMRSVAGISTGTLIWGGAGYFGIRSLFVAAPWIYFALKLVGGAYLAWLGIKLLWKSRISNDASTQQKTFTPSTNGAFRLGLLTNLSNPKTAVFVASLFAATMPKGASGLDGMATVMIMVAISFTWYSLVTMLFSSSTVSRIYGRFRRWIDRLTGGCFILIGVGLAANRS